MTNIKSVRFNLSIPEPVVNRLKVHADELDTSLSDILRRAFQLYEVSVQAIKEGKKVGIVGTDNKLEREFIGL